MSDQKAKLVKLGPKCAVDDDEDGPPPEGVRYRTIHGATRAEMEELHKDEINQWKADEKYPGYMKCIMFLDDCDEDFPGCTQAEMWVLMMALLFFIFCFAFRGTGIFILRFRNLNLKFQT